MADVSGYYWIDGIDLWIAFGMIIEKGSTEFLLLPKKKDSITHDWKDTHGIDTDLSKIVLDQREGTLQMAIIADSEEDFWIKHDSFIATLMKPGTRRLQIKAHQNRSYYIYYKSPGNYTQIKKLTGKDEDFFGPNKVMAKFSINVIEPGPQVNNSLVYIVDSAGRFIVT